MSEALQPTLFDYDTLDSETRIIVQQRAGEIKTLMRRSAADIVEIGQKLTEVKTRLGHGQFGGWLRSEFEWDDRTARHFMRVGETFKTENFSILSVAPSALYLLAAPSTPEGARTEALERAESGELITYSAAREIVTEHKAPQERGIGKLAGFVPFDDGYNNAFRSEPKTAVQSLRAPEPVHYLSDNYTAQTQPQAPPLAVHYSSATPEWYTPKHIIERVVRVFGRIDLDPCSNSHDAPNVPALNHYTQDDNGLVQPWYGRVYMNPPYGDEIGPWVARLVEQYDQGLIDQAIALVPGRIDTIWFQPLWAHTLCFLRGRLRFVGGDNSAPFPSVVVYLGIDDTAFRVSFGDLGRVGVLS